MIKLFATDLDGTLLGSTHRVDETVIHTIQEVLKNDRYFTIATGRSYMEGFEPVEKEIYQIRQNGAVIFNPQGELIAQKTIDKEVLKAFLEELSEYTLEYIDADKIYTLETEEQVISRMRKQLKEFGRDDSLVETIIHENLAHLETSCTKEYILSRNVDKVNFHKQKGVSYQKLDEFITKYSDKIVDAASSDDMYEITDIHVNKGEAVKILAKLLGVQSDEVAVYGDGGNDLQMLDMFEHSYSPIDASTKAKSKAKNIIGPFADYSVCKHILETINKKE